MNVLSLFDGISCGMMALEKLNIIPTNYYASEINDKAIKCSQSNYPSIIQLGDVNNWTSWGIDFSSIDLLLAGFPCQSWSISGKQEGDNDDRGKLLWIMLDILNHIKQLNPKVKFLFENVKMKKEFSDYVTKAIGVQPILINSSLLSAQNRNRYYWTNIPNITQPKDKQLLLRDIIEDGIVFNEMTSKGKSHALTASYNGAVYWNSLERKQRTMIGNEYVCAASRGRYLINGVRQDGKMKTAGLTEQRLEIRLDGKTNCLTTVQKDNILGCIEVGKAEGINGHDIIKRVYSINGKCPTLTAISGGNQEKKISLDNITWRKLTVRECARLQTIPEKYSFDSISKSEAYKAIGNGWTIDVIAHILSFMDSEVEESLFEFA